MHSSQRQVLLLVISCLIAANEAFMLRPNFARHGPRALKEDNHLSFLPPTRALLDSISLYANNDNGRPMPSRREWFQAIGGVVVSSGSACLPLLSNPAIAQAATEEEDVPEGLVSTKRLADLLHVIPTFTIVDAKGVPYMVVGEDAKVTGYFFIEYQEAKRILQVAKESADKAIAEAKRENRMAGQDNNNEDLVNPWKEARISTVPLDFAVTLITKSLYDRRAGGNYFQVAPSAQEIENALTITGKEDLAEGKVPLFYYENFTLPVASSSSSSSDKTSQPQTPLYFEKAQLEEAYRKAHPTNGSAAAALPPVRVTELFALLLEMVQPGGTDKDLQSLVFVPPVSSAAAVQTCQRDGRRAPPFLIGQRNIIL